MTSELLVARVHTRLIEEDRADDVAVVVAEEAPLLSTAERERTVRLVNDRLHGLGAIERLLATPDVSEIMVNGPGEVWLERRGAIEPAGIALDRWELEAVIERVLATAGRRIDPHRPWVDARLPDGSRVNVIATPVAVDGPYLTIRRFVVERPSLTDFAAPVLISELHELIDSGKTVVVSGGTGAGKTSLLNALAGRLPTATRVVTVEDAAELALPLPHVVRLECRPPGIEGDGEVSIRDLVRTALRMRPDRLIIGEVRGAEAYDLLQAFNTGHRGGLSTVHANSPADAFDRLLNLVLSADAGLPADVVVAQLHAAIDAVVHVERAPDGSRRVAAIERTARPRSC